MCKFEHEFQAMKTSCKGKKVRENMEPSRDLIWLQSKKQEGRNINQEAMEKHKLFRVGQ